MSVTQPGEPVSFREQVEARGQFIQTMVSVATILGHCTGVTRAYVKPVLDGACAKIIEHTPSGVVLVLHACKHSTAIAYKEATLKRAARKAEGAAKGFWQGVMA